MNPITNIKNQNALNEREIALGIAGDLGKSWHQKYKESAWIYIGGLPYDLSEGDIIAVFSQYGEVMNINLIRDRKTGKSKGFCFLCYQDQRSTVLAVDNFNGITLLKRMLRVDHVDEYKVPKYREDADEETKRLWEEGCAPKPIRRRQEPVQPKVDVKQEEMQILPTVPLKEDEDIIALKKKIKEDRKREKKEKKKAKKDKKKLKKLLKKAKKDPEGDWKNQIKMLDVKIEDDEMYEQNEHFNFGKKIEVEEDTHNPRPDFEKAEWRDIEIWKIIREQEKAQKGVKKSIWEEGENYVSSRYKK